MNTIERLLPLLLASLIVPAACKKPETPRGNDVPGVPESVPVALKDGVSPDGKHEVVLESDKGSDRYRAYEFKGDEFQFPAFLIREVSTGKVLARVSWGGDAGSDEQPLTAHSTVLWSPDGNSVALNTTERYYANTDIWTFHKDSGTFTRVELPDYKTLTGYDRPDSNDVRPRFYAQVVKWTPEGHMVYELMLSQTASYKGDDPLHHRITLRVSARGMDVIHREKPPEAE